MMCQPYESPLVRLLMAPAASPSLTLADWDVLLQQARSNRLLVRVAVCVEDRHLWDQVPIAVHPHLHANLQLSLKQRRDVLWELQQIHCALAALDCPLVLLKGAAYVAADLPAGRGRVFSDIDLMVPESHLAAAEQMLLSAHWIHTTTDPYDQRYYRRWTHQLPPLRHAFRGSVLDLHHTIVPKTARIALSAERLFTEARALPSSNSYLVLAPEDMVLHSAVHLFNDGEFSHSLRDLLDLHDLIAFFSREAGFWRRLLTRAETLDLRRPLSYACRFLSRVLGAPFPDAPWQELAAWLPAQPVRIAMDSLFDEALSPDHIRHRGILATCADWVLDARGHYLRMPLHLLLPHLIRKAVRRKRDKEGPHRLLPLEGPGGIREKPPL